MAVPTPKKQIWEDSCWAACMEMWTGCVNGMESHDEEWFVDNYSDRGIAGLEPEGHKFWALLNKYFLSDKILRGSSLTAKTIKEHLGKGGCFMYIEPDGATSHARLAYDYDSGRDALLIVDPATGYRSSHGVTGLKDIILVYKL